jgi:hypothetical protein
MGSNSQIIQSVTANSPVVLNNGQISIPKATSAVDGYLSHVDFATFTAGGTGVASLNALTGAVALSAGSNITLTPSGNTISIASTAAGGVTSVNSISGALTLSAGSNITLTPSGNSISISATGSNFSAGALTESTSAVLTISGGSTAVNGTGTTIQVKQASTSQSGFLGSSDWNTFNAKFTSPGTQAGNLFLASPNGSSGAVSPRAIVAADVPVLNQNTTGSASSLTSTLPVGNGGTGATSVTVSPVASAYAGWDGNKNLSASNFIDGYSTTATSVATTTLTVGSAFYQLFTGSTTQTVALPVVSTLSLGQQFLIVNRSSGVVTVQSSGANTLQAMAANTQLLVTVILTSGTSAASWDTIYASNVLSGASGASTSLNNLASTAINADLKFATDATNIIGASGGVNRPLGVIASNYVAAGQYPVSSNKLTYIGNLPDGTTGTYFYAGTGNSITWEINTAGTYLQNTAPATNYVGMQIGTNTSTYIFHDITSSGTPVMAQIDTVANGGLSATNRQISILTAGYGLQIKSGSNAKIGTAVLVGGTVTVSNTAITANSIVTLGMNAVGGTPGAHYISALTVGASFVISSTSGSDTSTVGYTITEKL